MKKEMLINVLQPEECRIAIVEDGILEELYVERTSLESYTGNIYKGKIVNLEPAIQAAFVDFSVGRNGFLHVSDVEPQYYERHQAESAPAPPTSREPQRPSERDRPRPIEDRDRPRPTDDRDRPRPIEDRDRPRPTDDRDRPRPIEDRDRPRPMDDRDRPRPVQDRDRPRPSDDRDRPRSMDDRDRPRPIEDRDRPRPTQDRDRPRPTQDRDRPRPSEDRDRPRPVQERDTSFGAGLPPLYPEERPRPRDRDRPDRSEKGRRDQSERRFGEGLIDDWKVPPAPRPLEAKAKVEPTPVAPPTPPPAPIVERVEETVPVWSKAKPEPDPFTWNDEPPARTRSRTPSAPVPPPAPTPVATDFEADLPPSRSARVREPRAPEPPPTRSRPVPRPTPPSAELPPAIDLPTDSWEHDLPPSRTARSRPPTSDRAPARPTPPPRAIEPEIEDLVRPRSTRGREELDAGEPQGPGSRESRSRGARGRSRTAPIEAREELIDEPLSSVEPEGDDLDESPRRGGRAAIRSRGGDRPAERPRPSPKEPLPPIESLLRPAPEPIEPAPPARDPRRDRERERPRSPEPAPPARGERPRPTARPVEPIEPARAPERPKVPHSRAGEPGYVPRHQRARPPEPVSFETEDRLGWSDPESDLDSDLDLDLDLDSDLEDTPAERLAKTEGRRRRRRGRGRRPKGEREVTASGVGSTTDLDADLDFPDLDEEDEPAPLPVAAPRRPAPAARRPEPPPRRAPAPAPSSPIDDFDFDDEPTGRLIDDEDDDDLDSDDDDLIASSDPDDEIDPELEEEIRREAEEIAELEREMGLRGPVEARPRRGEPARGRGGPKPPLQDIFRRGDEVLVQVIKESIGNKGPTLSTYISIPGRYLVLMPGLNRVGVSRKIADEGQRRKLRELMTELNPPKGLGFIVRTAGLDRTKGELARDLAYLLRLWKVILRRIKKSRSPAPIYQESDMITRTIRDIFNAEIDTIWIDEPQAFERAQEFLRVVMPRFVDRLKLYSEKVPLFHKYGLEEEIAKIQRRQVPLPLGGSIVIDQTEALVAIDVNSGNFRVENDAERTAYEMNLLAAKEIARQLRLRDMGGVIVNDFIDMREEKHRRGVEKALRDAIKRDRARTKVLRMSAFGLIEMTRQRIRPSLKRSVYEDCSNCTGAGVIKTVESMSIDVMRLLALAAHREEVRRINVAVAVPVATYLNNRKRLEIAKLETEGTMTIHVRPEEGVAAEHLQFECFDAANNEVRVLPAPIAPTRRGR